MTRASHLRTQATPAGWPRPQSRARAGYAAASWALLFAAPHFYWGVGGAAGLDTALNREILGHRDGWFLASTGASDCSASPVGWSRWPRSARGVSGRPPGCCAVCPGSGLRCWRPAPGHLRRVRVWPDRHHHHRADQRDEYLPLARWFLFLWLPWFALSAVAWGALASRSPRRRTGRIMPSDDSPMVSMVRMGSPVRFQWCSARSYR